MSSKKEFSLLRCLPLLQSVWPAARRRPKSSFGGLNEIDWTHEMTRNRDPGYVDSAG